MVTIEKYINNMLQGCLYLNFFFKEMSPIARSTSHTPKSMHKNGGLQETSFVDVEKMVSNINTMFPTVCETHIRMLLKKYHNSTALVISALQGKH